MRNDTLLLFCYGISVNMHVTNSLPYIFHKVDIVLSYIDSEINIRAPRSFCIQSVLHENRVSNICLF